MIFFSGSGKLLNQLHLLLLWFSVCMLIIKRFSLGSGNLNVRCNASERQALLTFKKGLVDPANLLSSWTNKEEDCCKWSRVGCDNETGHVIMLDLHQEGSGFWHVMRPMNPINGEIGPSLLELRYLSYLDLSNNAFELIPDFIGSLDKLTYLDLSWNKINGTFPYHLGNLSMLQYLDLSGNIGMTTDNFAWLTRLSSLKVLNISDLNLVTAVDWLQSIKLHRSLTTLQLSNSKFPKLNQPYLSDVNPSNSLTVLRFFNNTFNNTIHSWLFNVSIAPVDLQIVDCQLEGSISDSFGYITSLVHLDLSFNQFEGGIPTNFRNLCGLKTLDLSYNNLSVPFDDILQNLKCSKNSLEDLRLDSNNLRGSIPDFTEFSSLRGLFLHGNQLDGSFPQSFKNISRLSFLDVKNNQLVGSLPDFSKFPSLMELNVGKNNLNGLISEHNLSVLTRLQQLDLSYNSLAFNVSFDWIPSFQLDVINLACCKLGPFFPNWLQTQTNFSHLDMSNSNISDAIPSWFWNFPSRLLYLNLSFNHIYGQVSNLSLQLYDNPIVDLSSNLFYGPIPHFLSNTTALNLSKNKFSGNLSFLCTATNGTLNYLDLSNNQLSGDLTDCWFQFNWLTILNLENNNFYGKIPISMGSLYRIQSLRLRNNCKAYQQVQTQNHDS